MHAKLLCDENSVSIYNDLEELPSDLPKESTVVLYPSENAVTLEQFITSKKAPISNNEVPAGEPVQHIIVLESTWSGAPKMAASPQLQHFTFIKLNEAFKRETMFWRHQTFGPGFLCTIESIHQICLEYDALHLGAPGKPSRNYDILLFFFVIGYRKVINFYAANKDLLHPIWWQCSNNNNNADS